MKKIHFISSVLVLGVIFGLSGCTASSEVAPVSKAEVEKKVQSKVEEQPELVHMEKQGFLTIDSCAAQGAFTDCYLENYACGSDGCYKKTEPGVQKDVQIVLYSHKDGVTYKLDVSAIPAHEIDEGINRNDVTIIGDYDPATNTILAKEFKAPPPPKKSFFKGCL